MIKENQELLNRLHILSDGVILYGTLPAAFWIRFTLLPGGAVPAPLSSYLSLGVILTAVQLFVCGTFGLYQSFRASSLRQELERLWTASGLVIALLLSFLFIQRCADYSRLTLLIWSVLSTGLLSCKRFVLRRTLRSVRQKGFHQKRVLVLGSGELACAYFAAIRRRKELGYCAEGYVASKPLPDGAEQRWLGTFGELEGLLEETHPDEVICAIGLEEYGRMPEIITACEKAGTRLSIIPFYAQNMPSSSQLDELDGIPLLNLRRIPLDNWANAFCKRAVDVAGALALILVSSPVMLACAVGVKLSSPGPVIFKQERVGLGRKHFYMYKFRSMRINDHSDNAWSANRDHRKTRFGAFMRKFSLDELPQFFNVLKGDMSLVGPRPEIPRYVERFRNEVPLYMVRHQVRPGITGWAQVTGLRGDTSIRERVERDIYYIEHWSLLFDAEILLTTVFRGKFVNGETLK